MAERLTQVTLVEKEPHKLLQGEMMYSELHHAWLVGCPNPKCSHDSILHGIANLRGHTVIKSTDITVSPSVLCGCGAHYFIEHNQIRWC
jgi:hypothetical protein